VGSSLFVSFTERLPEAQRKADVLGLPLGSAQAARAFTFLHLNPVQLNPDVVAEHLLAGLTPTTQRVVIDNVGVLVHTLGARAADYLAALVHHLYAAGVTALLLVEIEGFTGLNVDVADTPLSALADTIVIVQQVVAQGAIRRVLAVVKMRYSDYDATLRELVIDEQGVRVLPAAQSAPGVLAAAAEASGLTAPLAETPPPA
jgi:circadian clock protein KaiC